MQKYSENGATFVTYTHEEVAALPRLAGAGRDMSDADITAAIYADPDTVDISTLPESPLRGRAALRAYFAPAVVDKLLRPRGRPYVEQPKQKISLRLSPDVVAYFRATGKGWQTRINALLRAAIAS